jgi:hypothetical protein|tara:strand:- start:207 stop:1211 length:1005 start_codon:yes stop_codon:yes gene_type:complete
MAYTTIDNPELHFQIKLYAGNSSTQSITLDGSEDMQPDWVVIKNRGTTNNWRIADSVRSADNSLMTNLNNEASDLANTITSFNSNGFSLGANASYVNDINATSNNYVAFCWKESATAGFDILTHTGTGSAHTVSHNLSAKPHTIFHKGVSHDHQWMVQHHSIGATMSLVLSSTAAQDDSATQWNDTEPTSSVFTVGTNGQVNTASSTYVAYLFTSIQGFSKMGSYIGNGNVNGTYVHLGFNPAFVWIKEATATSGWILHNDKMNDNINPMQNFLQPNETGTESDNANLAVDFLSNGFKVRNDKGDTNTSGNTMVFWAFAEQPFVNSKGVPCNAR